MGRGGLDEWESWLDTLDGKLYPARGAIHVEFDTPLSIPLRYCRDTEGLVACAALLRDVFLANKTHYLPDNYLVRRFVALAIKANNLRVTRAQIMLMLPAEWDYGTAP